MDGGKGITATHLQLSNYKYADSSDYGKEDWRAAKRASFRICLMRNGVRFDPMTQCARFPAVSTL